MALTERTEQKLEILPNGIIQVQDINIIDRDGGEVSRQYHRHCLAPADDLTNEGSKVVAIANVTWTPEVIAAYQASLVESV